ncbi:MAG: hypothetical protein IKL16_05400 [Clostridia bacterium]|nr:hypothetical protein [Clostridia bacterium]
MFFLRKRYLARYLYKGLNLDDFDVIDILPQDRHSAVIIMKNKHSYAPKKWCLQYRGNRHYFDTEEELNAYFKERKFKNKMKGRKHYEV